MRRSRITAVLTFSCTVCFLSGCLALSFGGKSQQVETVVTESPETLKRIDQLESRVQALEQQAGPGMLPPPLP